MPGLIPSTPGLLPGRKGLLPARGCGGYSCDPSAEDLWATVEAAGLFVTIPVIADNPLNPDSCLCDTLPTGVYELSYISLGRWRYPASPTVIDVDCDEESWNVYIYAAIRCFDGVPEICVAVRNDDDDTMSFWWAKQYPSGTLPASDSLPANTLCAESTANPCEIDADASYSIG